jgi:hypothetical protein
MVPIWHFLTRPSRPPSPDRFISVPAIKRKEKKHAFIRLKANLRIDERIFSFNLLIIAGSKRLNRALGPSGDENECVLEDPRFVLID